MALQFEADDVAATPSTEQLAELAELARTWLELKEAVDRRQEELDAAKDRFRVVSEERIPDVMDRIGMAEFKLSTGEKVKVERGLRCSIPKDPSRRAAAFAWLRTHGGEALIRRQVEVEFGKGEGAAAEGLVRLLRERGDKFSDGEDVHTGQLKAFVKELMEGGTDVPLEDLGAFEFVETKIKA